MAAFPPLLALNVAGQLVALVLDDFSVRETLFGFMGDDAPHFGRDPEQVVYVDSVLLALTPADPFDPECFEGACRQCDVLLADDAIIDL